MRSFDMLIEEVLNVGPSFTDLGFSYLLGDMAGCKLEWSDGEEIKDFGEVRLITMSTPDGELKLDGWGMLQLLMSFVQEFGSEVVEQACKQGFISVGLTPTESRFHPPQLLDGDALAEVTRHVLQLWWSDMEADFGTVESEAIL